MKTLRLGAACAVALTLLGGELASAQSAPVLGPEARAQISALLAEKRSRTRTQAKLDSKLLFEMKWRRRDPLMDRLPKLRRSVEVRSDGATLVDLDGRIGPAVEQRIRELGGAIESSHSAWSKLRAWVPVMALESLAAHPDVRWIKPASKPMTRVVSQGDNAHLANVARSTFGTNGLGVKICAISDGVDALETLQRSGELPPVDVLPGQRGQGTEGTAMLEIIHDLAPGAALGFATAQGGMQVFADNIQRLRTAGCDVIVDDIFYVDEPVFQDGMIAQSVTTVVTEMPRGPFRGAVYVTAAGNDGGLSRFNSSVWQDNFSGVPGVVLDGTSVLLNSFRPGGPTFNQVDRDPRGAFVLTWTDPFGASSNDYDLLLMDSTLTNVISMSIDEQSGSQDPIEVINSADDDDLGTFIVIFRFAGEGRLVRVQAIGEGALRFQTGGNIFGHAGVEDAITVGAAIAGSDPNQPFPRGRGIVEPFSSDGPRRIFFTPTGVPLTPGDFSAFGGRTVLKPDVVGADGVSTATPDERFRTFFGTSAAAPHVAAIAGLMISASLRAPNPGPLPVPFLVNATIKPTLAGTAIRRGVSRDQVFDEGAGVVNAFTAVQSAAAGLPCFDLVDNDGDGRADVNDDPGCAALFSPTEAPACDDRVDNDQDGRVDLADGGCISPSDGDECGGGAGQSMAVVPLLAYLGRRRRSKRSS